MSTTKPFTIHRLNTFIDRISDTDRGRPMQRLAPAPVTFTRPIPTDAVCERLLSAAAFSPRWRTRSPEAILDAYQAAAARLQGWIQQTQAFIHEMFDRAVEYDGFGSLSGERTPGSQVAPFSLALQATADLVAEHREFSCSLPASPLARIEFLALAGDRLYPQLRQDLENRINQFVARLISHFHAMAERGVVGTAQFAGPRHQICRFTYFHSRVICRRHSLRSRLLRQSEGVPYLARPDKSHQGQQPEWWKERRRTVELLASGSVTIRHVSTQVVLTRAKTTQVRRWRSPLPHRIVDLLSAMPPFLKEHAAITTGTRRHAQMIERDVKEFPWTYSREETRVDTVRHDDPAVLFGPWVIAGYCDETPLMPRRLWWHRRRNALNCKERSR